MGLLAWIEQDPYKFLNGLAFPFKVTWTVFLTCQRKASNVVKQAVVVILSPFVIPKSQQASPDEETS